MIGYIKGELADVSKDSIIVENNGIGYELQVPLSVLNEMPAAGQTVKIYTYMYVREDILALFGFLTRDELGIFKQLITVSGIGPKGALAILSTMSTDQLRFAVMSDDVKTISKSPGIGTKTAQKLIIELKGKIDAEVFQESTGQAQAASGGAKEDVVLALAALGYSGSDALRAVNAADTGNDIDSEQLLKLALKKIMTF